MTNLSCTAFLAEHIQNLKIAVIGDVMLDRYFYGEVKRISPEAPVPVNKVKRIKSVLGGAANVAANLAHLECRVFMGGVTGADNNREVLEEMMAEKGIDYSGLIKSQQRETITKMRILGAQQQMLRLDFEETGDLFPEETEALSLWLQNLLEAGLDGVIVSDYAKGVCSDNFVQWVIAAAHQYQVPVLIDPKGADWNKYRGCDFITPNLKEMCEAAGEFVPNEDEDDHGQSTMAMEAMLEDRDETYKNFIELEYGYTLTEKKARNGYMVHGTHREDFEIERIVVSSAQAQGEAMGEDEISEHEAMEQDEILVFGPDLTELRGDSAYARIALLRVGDIESDDEDDTEQAFRAIQDMDFVKYHVFPKGYMIRTSSESNREQVRLSSAALKKGISFRAVGNDFIRQYKQNPNILAVKLIFITAPDADYAALEQEAKTVRDITMSLSKILEGMPTDCGSCNLKPICDEVEGMRELHFGKEKHTTE